MEAVRLVLLAFNKETPVCSVAPRQSAPKHGIAASSSSRQAPTTTSRSVASSAPTHVLPSAPSLLPTPAPAREPATVPAPKVPQKVTPPATAENDAAKFKEVEEVLRAAIDSARRKINADIRDARAALVKDYNYDMAKYDIHRLMMADWVPTCKDVGSSLKAQYAEEAKLKEALAKCSTQLRTLEEVDHYLTRVVEEVREVNALRDELDDARCSEASFQRNIKFQSTSDERLCRAVASEAAVDAMLETLTATFKRKQLSTKQYIHVSSLLVVVSHVRSSCDCSTTKSSTPCTRGGPSRQLKP
ncbi:tumor susceptibility gene 101 domain containing protein [Babesia caballi]|uniref:Tumor susceptibility gene 101 domain containing protein n=1 Tax=Babesia caballi TaxID=5871 RepID=A0AAV4LR08_BABCB|nr:tumor susceptibility gene 101 domain containing protein [Babesia caballi]